MHQIEHYLQKPLWAGRINAPDPQSGHPPVALAAWRGHVEAVERLLDAGASAPVAFEAAIRGHGIHVIDMLISRGADVDGITPTGATILRNNRGWRPLHFAAYYGSCCTVRSLVRGGAQVNARDTNGDTALHIAAGNDHAECVKVLCELGADVRALGKSNETALMRAQHCEKRGGCQSGPSCDRTKRHQGAVIEALRAAANLSRPAGVAAASSRHRGKSGLAVSAASRPLKHAAADAAQSAPSYKRHREGSGTDSPRVLPTQRVDLETGVYAGWTRRASRKDPSKFFLRSPDGSQKVWERWALEKLAIGEEPEEAPPCDFKPSFKQQRHAIEVD